MSSIFLALQVPTWLQFLHSSVSRQFPANLRASCPKRLPSGAGGKFWNAGISEVIGITELATKLGLDVVSGEVVETSQASFHISHSSECSPA